MKALNLLVFWFIPFLSLAEQAPKAYPLDLRVKHLAFQENNVVRLKAKPFITTQIRFAKNEAILTVEGGDTSAWIVTYHENLPNMLFIKPTPLKSHTNLTVVTTEHTYYFAIQSENAPNSKPLYALYFDYPKEAKALTRMPKQTLKKPATSIKKAKPLNLEYRFSGSAQLIPKRVYDDGRFTYFELADQQEVPAIFAVNNQDGKEALVNLRQQGNTLIILRLAPQFSLRKGALVASVFNTKAINRIQERRR